MIHPSERSDQGDDINGPISDRHAGENEEDRDSGEGAADDSILETFPSGDSGRETMGIGDDPDIIGEDEV